MRSPARPVTRVPAATGEARHGTDPRQGIARYGIEGRSFRSHGGRPLRHAHHRPHGFDRHRIERTNTGPRAIAADRRSACAGKTVRAKFRGQGGLGYAPAISRRGRVHRHPARRGDPVCFQRGGVPGSIQRFGAGGRCNGPTTRPRRGQLTKPHVSGGTPFHFRIDNAGAAPGRPDPFNLQVIFFVLSHDSTITRPDLTPGGQGACRRARVSV